ncbi:2-keto-4-pentenoate hydratase/2-oxohepta-3-ene-1,7-dioic acid hydratase (catechol pathway) [Mesobacillus persicus]|uniref:2-keto-4-pentenoate hydratase/2-oxohepta-3-ene-1,7-dioic acid hydratase (Catechol pathway) n=1 Tax=Mesobacillus persicus TaxID=930146 RepID=A0A1H7WJM4_9BACI|nr:fumarylacetoacetate hydrolase family protein [Mesobacillus persicus]SEM21691.1 2-keto-4-pentenoate hydratase/2-oxohepta-3-ene-1,7-dioic acid hydratase (catechol pathway) [Mesobacillus persicus]
MKLLSFYEENKVKLGVKTNDGIIDVEAAAAFTGLSVPTTMLEVVTGGNKAIDQLNQLALQAPSILQEDAIQFAPAIHNPQKVLCVGANYRKHAEESGLPIPNDPIYFSKYANSLAAHRDKIELPNFTEEVDYEVELVVVIGKQTKRVSPSEALDYVFGYAVGNDLSARDLQFRSSQWLYGKAIDGFAPLGPYLVTADEVQNPQNLTLKCWVNGELRQNSNTEDMIFNVATIISDLSQIMTLEPGDVIYTGTPEGVILGMEQKTWLDSGDEIVCEIDGLGRLVNQLYRS